MTFSFLPKSFAVCANIGCGGADGRTTFPIISMDALREQACPYCGEVLNEDDIFSGYFHDDAHQKAKELREEKIRRRFAEVD